MDALHRSRAFTWTTSFHEFKERFVNRCANHFATLARFPHHQQSIVLPAHKPLRRQSRFSASLSRSSRLVGADAFRIPTFYLTHQTARKYSSGQQPVQFSGRSFSPDQCPLWVESGHSRTDVRHANYLPLMVANAQCVPNENGSTVAAIPTPSIEQVELDNLLLAAAHRNCTNKTSAEQRERQWFGDPCRNAVELIVKNIYPLGHANA